MNFARFKAATLFAIISASWSGEVPLVSPIFGPHELAGCSWHVPAPTSSPTEEAFHFLARLDDAYAIVRIDGLDVRLTQVSSRGEFSKIGDVVEKVFVAGDHRVSVRFVATWLCARDDDDCELAQYRATIKVEKGNRSQVIEADGAVGC